MRFKKGGTGMLTRMKTASLQGVNGYPVTVETDLHRGMPGFQIVGLADTTIKEAFSRIRPAIINSGYRFPREKVTVNLSPAGKPKEGSHFDLPIALGILLLTLGEEAQIEDTAFLENFRWMARSIRSEEHCRWRYVPGKRVCTISCFPCKIVRRRLF